MNSENSASGLILLDKAAGVTSCNALFPIRKIFQTRRVGHAGSLDMRASGLIVAAVGRNTFTYVVSTVAVNFRTESVRVRDSLYFFQFSCVVIIFCLNICESVNS